MRKKTSYNHLISFCAFLLLTLSGFSQGTPAIRYYTPSEYKGFAQNWCITQDKRGVLYFGNGKGILEFNGRTWRRFFTEQHSTVLSLGTDSAGKVYVGGEGEVGYLSADSLGETYFVSLNDKISEKEKKFTYVWSTYATHEGICFVTGEKILCWNGKTMTYVHPKEAFYTSFCVNGTLYVMSNGEGLVRFKSGKTELLKNTEKLDKAGVRAVMPYGKNELLIVSRNLGSFIYDGNELKKLETEAENYLRTKALYKGTQLPDGNYALATTGGGVVIMDKNGKTLETINESKGLRGLSIYGVFVDREKELWLAQESGLSRIRYSLPIRFIDDRHGVNGIVRNLFRLNNSVYVSTFQGLFKQQNKDSFAVYASVNMQVAAAAPFQNKSVIAATEKYGIIEIIDDKKTQLGNQEYVLSLLADAKLPIVYAGALGKAHVFSKENDKWKKVTTIDSLDDEISFMVINKNTLWLSTSSAGLIYRVQFKDEQRTSYTLERFDSLNALPQGIIEVYVFNNILYAATTEGVFEFNEQSKKFIKNTKLWNTDGQDYSDYAFLLAIDKSNNHWALNKKGICYFKNGVFYNAPFKCVGFTDYYALLNDTNNVTWIGGTNGVAVYRPNNFKKFDLAYDVLINRVVHGRDTIFKGTFLSPDNNFISSQTEAFRFQFPFKQNAISFEFSTPFFDNEESMAYSYKLEGFDEEWSDWNSETKKEYTNLHEGEYTFKIKAKNIYGTESKTTEFSFTIITPWYRTWLAYGGFGVVVVLIVYMVIRLKTAQLKRENEKLERIVKERTAEITHQKEVIEEKQKEILDSIYYARRIQRALITSEKYIERNLNRFRDKKKE